MNEYSIGEYIIYRNGEKYELGRIKSLQEDGAFVAYHEGETGAKTPYSHMHKLINQYCIKDTSFGGDYFKVDIPQTERIKTHDYCDICNHKGCDNCIANSLDDYCVPSGYVPKYTPQFDSE